MCIKYALMLLYIHEYQTNRKEYKKLVEIILYALLIAMTNNINFMCISKLRRKHLLDMLLSYKLLTTVFLLENYHRQRNKQFLFSLNL